MSDQIIEKYIWASSDNSCEACESLNGKEFKSLDEVPDKPHLFRV